MPALIVNSSLVQTETFRTLELHADYGCGNSGHCCFNSWKVALDASRLPRLLKSLADSGMPQPEIDSHIALNPSGNEMERGHIKKNPSAHCSFVAGEPGKSSCSLHSRCGHPALPDICQSFPRIVVRTPAGVYMTLTYSCPTAAKLLLKKDALHEVQPRSVHRRDQTLVGVALGDAKPAPDWIPGVHPEWRAFDYFWRWAVEFVARPGLSPAQALYSLGIIVGAVEQHARDLKELESLIGMLDSVSANPVSSFAARCQSIPPLTELGLTYFDAVLKQIDPSHGIHKQYSALGDPWRRTPDDKARLIAEYDARIRPHLPEFETIERNYVGSRLYANPLCYRASRLRMGWFANVLMLTGLRFTMLALSLEEGRPLDEKMCLKAAGITDDLMIHHAVLQTTFLEALKPFMNGELPDLMRAALF